MLHFLFSTARIINNRGPLLFKAIQENNEAEVRNILNSYFCPAWSEVHAKDKPQSQIDIFDWGSQSFAIFETLFAHYGLQIFGCNSSWQAFLCAAEKGHLPLVTLLLEKCDAQLSATNMGDALYNAACQGHLPVVALLLKKYSTQISAKSKGDALYRAAERGHLLVVALLLTKCSTQISAADKSEALCEAAEEGHLLVVALLLTKCSTQISVADKSKALCEAIRQGHLSVATLLLEKCDAELSATNKEDALCNATHQGHLPVVTLLLKKCSPQISAKVKGAALSDAAARGHLLLVTLLLKKCGQEISAEDKGKALRSAATEKQLLVVNFLLENYSQQINAAKKGEALYNAALQGHLPVVALLLEKCAAQISAEAKGMALSRAALKGYLRVVTLLLEKCAMEISAEHKSMALYEAASQGHPPVVTLLLDRCSAQISAANKSWALIAAVLEGHLSTLEALLADASVSAVATWRNNAALIEAQTRARGDEEDYARYQPIVERLLQIPAVAQLAQTQQHALDLAVRAGFAENSMQALTTPEKVLIERVKHHYAAQYADKGWEVIRAEILSYLEAAYQQSPAKDGYHYVKMLAPGAEFYELSADTLVLKPQDAACIAFYGHEGAIQERSLPWEQVEEIYHANNKQHLLYQTSQDETLCQALLKAYNIPSPHQDQPLPLAYSVPLSPSALVVYYRHLIHGAWRYLSHSNPWMDPAASFVHTLADGQRQAIISDADKELLSYFWLALTDEQVQLEPGFTPAGNLNLFAAALAAINRGHNTDERPVNPADFAAWKNHVPGIKTTCEDDLKADRPSCSYGVTKRLLENAYGHPYIMCPHPDPDILLTRMQAHLVCRKGDKQQQDNLIDKLEKLPLPILQALQHEIGMICDMAEQADKIILTPEQEEQKKQALTPSIAQLTAFIDDCKRWFGESRISDIQAKPFICRQVDQEHQHQSYETFIHYCAAHPLKAFTTVINEAIQALIDKANKPEAMLITYLANLQLKREERPGVSSVTEPDTLENPSCKRKSAYH